MEALLESDIAKLVLDYLKKEKSDSAYRVFCKNNPYLKEEYHLYKKGCTPIRTFNLRDILFEYFETKILLEKFCDQRADYNNLKQNLPFQLRYVLNLVKEQSTYDDDDDAEEEQTFFKKPAARKRRKSDDSILSTDTNFTATSTPEKNAPPHKKQKISSSFTILNQTEATPSLHRQMGRKWTEQHDYEVPETDDSCSTANDSLVIADENDGAGNKTVIDNAILTETMLQHDFPHILASTINRGLQNVSNNSNSNDPNDGSDDVVTGENVASTSGLSKTANNNSLVGTPQSLEAQLQLAINNIVCDTENNPVFVDILNNLFAPTAAQTTTGSVTKKQIPHKPINNLVEVEDISPIQPVDSVQPKKPAAVNKSRRKKGPKKISPLAQSSAKTIKTSVATISSTSASTTTTSVMTATTKVMSGNNILIEIPTEMPEIPSTSVDNTVLAETSTMSYQHLQQQGDSMQNVYFYQQQNGENQMITSTGNSNIQTLKISGQSEGETYLVTVPLYSMPNLDGNESFYSGNDMPIYIETMAAPVENAGDSIPEPGQNVEICTTSGGFELVDSDGQIVTLAQLAAAATASSVKKDTTQEEQQQQKRDGTTPEHSFIQKNFIMRKSMSTPRRKLSHVRILSFPSPSKRLHQFQQQHQQQKHPTAAAAMLPCLVSSGENSNMINVDAIFNSVDDDASRVNDATISTTMETIEEIIVPVTSIATASASARIGTTPKVLSKNPRKCVRTLSRSASEDGSVKNEKTKKTTTKRTPKSTKKPKKGKSGDTVPVKHIPIQTKSPARTVARTLQTTSAKKATTLTPNRSILTRQKQANMLVEWQNMRQISKNNFDQHIRAVERETDLAIKQAKLENKPPPQKRGRKPKSAEAHEREEIEEEEQPVAPAISMKVVAKTNDERGKATECPPAEMPKILAQTPPKLPVKSAEKIVLPIMRNQPPTIEYHVIPPPEAEAPIIREPETVEDPPIVQEPEIVLPAEQIFTPTNAPIPETIIASSSTSFPSMSSLNLFSLMDTPFKSDFSNIPDTPRFVLPSLQDTPIVKSIFVQNNSMQKYNNPMDFPTPSFAITPGGGGAPTASGATGLPTTTPKSVVSGAETTGEKSDSYNRKTDYSSGSSYYRPDESEDIDIDNRLDAMLLSERRRRRRHKPVSDSDAAAPITVVEQEKEQVPAEVTASNVGNVTSIIEESQSRETIIFLQGSSSNMARIYQQIQNSPTKEITLDVEANGDDTSEGYARYRMLGTSGSVASRDVSADASSSSYTSVSDSSSGSDSETSAEPDKHPPMTGRLIKKLKNRVKEHNTPEATTTTTRYPLRHNLISPAKLMSTGQDAQLTPEKTMDKLEQRSMQVALLEEKKLRTIAMIKKQRFQARNAKIIKPRSKIQTMLHGPVPRNRSPLRPLIKKKMPVGRPPKQQPAPPLPSRRKPQTPRKIMILNNCVTQYIKKSEVESPVCEPQPSTSALNVSASESLVDDEVFPKLSITPDRDEIVAAKHSKPGSQGKGKRKSKSERNAKTPEPTVDELEKQLALLHGRTPTPKQNETRIPTDAVEKTTIIRIPDSPGSIKSVSTQKEEPKAIEAVVEVLPQQDEKKSQPKTLKKAVGKDSKKHEKKGTEQKLDKSAPAKTSAVPEPKRTKEQTILTSVSKPQPVLRVEVKKPVVSVEQTAKERKSTTVVTSKFSEKKQTEADSSNDLKETSKKETTDKLPAQSLRPPLQVGEVSNTDTEDNEANSSSKNAVPEKPVAPIQPNEVEKPSEESSSDEESGDDFDDVELCRSDEVRTNRIFVNMEYDEEAYNANPPKKPPKIDLKTHVFKLYIEDRGLKILTTSDEKLLYEVRPRNMSAKSSPTMANTVKRKSVTFDDHTTMVMIPHKQDAYDGDDLSNSSGKSEDKVQDHVRSEAKSVEQQTPSTSKVETEEEAKSALTKSPEKIIAKDKESPKKVMRFAQTVRRDAWMADIGGTTIPLHPKFKGKKHGDSPEVLATKNSRLDEIKRQEAAENNKQKEEKSHSSKPTTLEGSVKMPLKIDLKQKPSKSSLLESNVEPEKVDINVILSQLHGS